VALAIGALLVHEPLKIQDVLALGFIIVGVYVLQTGKTAPLPATAVDT
jgi:multidrug transporter EmrE-like cation transporter